MAHYCCTISNNAVSPAFSHTAFARCWNRATAQAAWGYKGWIWDFSGALWNLCVSRWKALPVSGWHRLHLPGIQQSLPVRNPKGHTPPGHLSFVLLLKSITESIFFSILETKYLQFRKQICIYSSGIQGVKGRRAQMTFPLQKNDLN